MVGEVNKIIYNMLVSGKGVFLPTVGTLYIERKGARKISETRLLSPHNVISYSSLEQAPSLVREIVSIAGCEESQAQDIYERWLMKTRVDNKLTFEGVGVLVGKAFTVDSALGKAINPQGVKTLVIRRKKSGAWIYVVCAVSVICALGFLAYILWGDEVGLSAAKKDLVAEQVEVIPAMEIVPADSIAKTSEGTVVAEQSDGATKEQTAEVAVVAKEYAYYVVMGIFSTQENADRAVEQVKKKIEDPQCKILPFKDKFMVTIYGSDTAGDCNAYAKSYHDIYPDLWVYARK